jgi:CDP-glucose 4,6-dehydratase
VRPWQHVLEPLSGYLMLAEQLISHADRFSGAWNFGPRPDATRAVGDVVAFFEGHWLGRLRCLVDDAGHPHEAARLSLDSTKAIRELGWSQRLDTDESLMLAASWYEEYWDGTRDLRQLTELQIADYASRAESSIPRLRPARMAKPAPT